MEKDIKKIKLIVISGPTASGKTALALEMAKRFDGEIISADSMQIYKGMDIATAKPSLSEQSLVKHHLIGFLEQSETFSVAMFKSLADAAICEIVSRGKMPILVGGTGLYIDAVINNLTYMENTNSPQIRSMLQSRLEIEGGSKLYQELLNIDPVTAEKIHPNNTVKLLRALEIYYSNGQTLTKQNEHSKSNSNPYDVRMICLFAQNRDYLYNRINQRVDNMLEVGLLEEAKSFYENKISNTSAQAIGYKELKPYIDGISSLGECVDNLKKATRRYAKRQLTWFRRYDKITWIPIDKHKTVEEQADICQNILN